MRTILLISMLTLTALPLRGEDTSPVDVARNALDAVIQGDYDTFAPLADDAVKQAVSKEMLAAIGGQLETQFGEFIDVLGFEPSSRDGYEIFVFALDYKRAEVKMMVAINAAGKVSGLRVLGADQKAEWAEPAYADPAAFTEEDVVVGAAGFELPGTLTLPTGAEAVPAVVLVHGSGPNDRDETIGPNKIFKDLAWGLASDGLAVLRYEKRTKAFPTKIDVSTLTLEEEVIDDAVAAVSFLRSRKEIDPSRIYVLGHSLGGLAAPFIVEKDDEIAGTIVMAGPARPMLDVLAYQIEHLAKLNGTWSDEVASEIERIDDIARRGRGGDDLGDETIMGMPVRYWLDIDRRDPASTAEKTRKPMLLIQGGRDYQVTMDCFAIWEKKMSGASFARLVLFDDLNHLMMSGAGASSPAEYQETGHVDERVVDAVSSWILGSE